MRSSRQCTKNSNTRHEHQYVVDGINVHVGPEFEVILEQIFKAKCGSFFVLLIALYLLACGRWVDVRGIDGCVAV